MRIFESTRVFVCVRVIEREREQDRESERERERERERDVHYLQRNRFLSVHLSL